jgi:heme-degrading monooxygenase HmoA
MIAVIFEVVPLAAGRSRYLDLAAQLGAELPTRDGFVSIERFQSLQQPDKILSLSFWRDEAAVKGWRMQGAHRLAQAEGRGELFADYRMRIASVVRDYGLRERNGAPRDSLLTHADS